MNEELLQHARLRQIPHGEFRAIDLRGAVESGIAAEGIRCSFTAAYFVDLSGAVTFPFVNELYATKTLPPLSAVLACSWSGLLDMSYAWLWPRLAPGLVLGLVYAVVGGVAPLLADSNVYTPREVRMAHLIEMTPRTSCSA
jgi:hypothetical protein